MKKLSYISVLLFTLFVFTSGVYAACPLGPDVTKDLYGVLKVIRIAAPLLVIAFTIFESIQAITKGDAAADFKKVAIRFGKRSIYAVILFFLPIIIDQVMQMANVWGEGGSCDIEHAEENGTENSNNNSNGNNGQNGNNGNNSNGNNGQNGNNTGNENDSDDDNNHYDVPGFSCSNFKDSKSCDASGCDWYGGYCYPKENKNNNSNSSSNSGNNGQNGNNTGNNNNGGNSNNNSNNGQSGSQTKKKGCKDYTNLQEPCPVYPKLAENGERCQPRGFGATSSCDVYKPSNQNNTESSSNNSSSSEQKVKKKCSEYFVPCPDKDDYGNACEPPKNTIGNGKCKFKPIA